MPPGAGKTTTALAIVDDLQLRPLVLVHTKDLMTQWLNAARNDLGIWLEHIGGDLPAEYTPPEGVETCGTVAMVQTLTTWPRAKTERMAAKHGVVFLDEAHHAPATTFFRALWGIGCARRYALTATPERPDGLTSMLHWCFGPEISRTTNSELQQAGVSVRPTVRRVDTTFEFELRRRVVVSHDAPTRWAKSLRWKSPTYGRVLESTNSLVEKACRVTARMLSDSIVEPLLKAAKLRGWTANAIVDSESLAACMKALCQDPTRIALAAQLVYDLVAEGRQTLVLAQRVDHCQRIADACEALGIEAKVLTGKMSSKKRDAVLAELRSGELRVCVATTLADEGLDVPTLSGMVNAYPGRAAGKTTQRAGRLMRPHPDQPQPVLLDMVDSRIPLFVNQWYARVRAYRSASCEVVK
jgi:superfamily II DNA or RNA helicase